MAPGSARQLKTSSPNDELRCDCGRLVARRVSGGIELRCGRCKARLFIALGSDDVVGRLRVVRCP